MVEARPAEARILYLGFPSGLNVKVSLSGIDCVVAFSYEEGGDFIL